MRENVPWVKLVWSLYGNRVPHAQSRRGCFWWRDIFSLVEDYRSITKCAVGNGTSILFWKDFWLEGELLCDKYPRLYSYAINEDMSVADMSLVPDIRSCFALPLSVEAYSEFQEVSHLITDHPIDATAPDRRVFVWGNSTYAASKYYNFLFAQLPQDPALNAIWKSKSLPKLRVFAWLLMLDRLNTRDLMRRKNWHLDSGPNCVLCDEARLETNDHLFFDCHFAKQCWEKLGIQWDTSLHISKRFLQARNNFSGPCFMEALVCAAWNIWKERNYLIFQGQQPSLRHWRVRFQHDLMLHRYRVKASLVQPLVDWVLNIFV
jgi:hypothetical protein